MIAWARAPWDQAEADRRKHAIDRLARVAEGLPPDPDRDSQGRLILRGFQAVKGWIERMMKRH